MESEGSLQRTPSDTSSSTASSQKQRNRTVRTKRRRHSTSLKTGTPKVEDKSLTSFPSLSPEFSPQHAAEAKLRSTLAEVDANQGSRKPLKQKRSIVAALTAKSPSARGRGSLFEDSPTSAVQEVPGSIHYSSDAHVERLIARNGAVALIRQLAEDLANREAEMSALRHRAELRERELKKMLREVEVSNMDIETRLHNLDQDIENRKGGKGKNAASKDKDRKKGIRTSDGPAVEAMMEEAIEDPVASGDEFGGGAIDRAEEDRQATIRARALRESDAASTASSQGTAASKGTNRGWKDYIWSGTGTRKTSRTESIWSNEERVTARKDGQPNNPMRRKGLDQSLFRPPNIDENDVLSGDDASHASDKQRATSMSSWTMRLFGGNSQAKKDSLDQGTVRGRAQTSSSVQTKNSRATSQASQATNNSAKASLARMDPKTRRSVTPLNFGTGGTVKSSASSSSNVALASPKPADESTNLGPVEMDAILPHGSRPPTLTPSYHNIDDSSDLLTDRFGFIYDQRRRKKEAQALARVNASKDQPVKETLAGPIDRMDAESLEDQHVDTPSSPNSTEESIDGRPTNKWQDYLKYATFPTELLSHTPSSATIMTISNPEIQRSLRRTSTMEGIRENQPASTPNPLPATSAITATNAEIASPVISTPITPIAPARTEFEPVKALLAQLTELHDNIQRDKMVKWNEFLRKVRVERRKEGESGSAESRTKLAAMPEASLTDGETIGIATLGNKGKVGRAKYREFKVLVLAGVPVALRAKVWAECSGASALRIPGYYADLVQSGEDDPIILAQIQMDINRTLTDNVFFRRGPGVTKLNEVLLAYSRRNPEVGYCQGMNLIAASLLLIMPTAEDAFWVLVSIIENILPRHYYDNSLLTSRADQQVLRQYVTELLPRLSAHLDELSIELEALTFQWFLSLFTDCLSAEALYRVWDVLICCKDEEGNGGSTFLFQVALALLKLNETQLTACESPGEVYAYLGGEITNHAISIDGLIKASEGLKALVRRPEVEERREKWVKVEKETIEERERIRSGKAKRKDVEAEEAGGELTNGGDLTMQSPVPISE